MEARNAHLQGNVRNAMDLMDARRANAKLEGAAEEGEAAPAPVAPAPTALPS
jgi:hypothetical protein